MYKNKKPHVFWILVDSARNFETEIDDRGLPKAVREMSDEFVYFKNVVTSAPSTIMSVSSIMTSKASYLHSRSYNNFPGITHEFASLPEELKNNGYNILGSIYFKHGREVLSDLFGRDINKYLSKKLRDKEIWTNVDVLATFQNILRNKNWKKPSFTYLHFNVRVDDNISNILRETRNALKSYNLWDDSLIIINSDHGYPMPSRGWNKAAANKKGWSHDQLLYNDNILTPLLIKHPKLKAKCIDTYISTLDIAPTLMSIIGLKIPTRFSGIDLIPNLIDDTIDMTDRPIRTDNRFCGQSPQGISIIKGDKKLIALIDDETGNQYELFDLTQDPLEKNDLFEKDAFLGLRNEMLVVLEESENEFMKFHESYLRERWKKHLNMIQPKAKVGVVICSTRKMKSLVSDVLYQILPSDSAVYIIDEMDSLTPHFDNLIVIVESEIPWDYKQKYSKILTSVSSNKIFFLDNNGNNLGRHPQLYLYRKFLKKRIQLLNWSPIQLISLFMRVIFKRTLKTVKA